MSNDPFRERGQALEDLFFQNVDAKLLAKMSEELKATQAQKNLALATGICDAATLASLVKNNISAESLVAISFVPLVAIAWSDGVLDPTERSAVERAIADEGLASDSAAFQLIQHWLAQKPSATLIAAWKAYMQSIKLRMEPAPYAQMRTNVLNRSTKVAQAAGGFMGLGSKISDSEQRVLDDLTAAL